MVAATSLGFPIHLIGMQARSSCFSGLATGLIVRNIGLSIGPGAIVFTVMPKVASLSADTRVKPNYLLVVIARVFVALANPISLDALVILWMR